MAEQPMKVLVVSDVHGRVTPLRWLLKNETADALFFLGDGLYDLDQAIAAGHCILPVCVPSGGNQHP